MDITQLKVGDKLDSGEFFCVTQTQVNEFADATGDHQWIHLDQARCEKYSPFKTTIAHGFLTLSLMPKMFAQSVEIDPSTTTMINYGMDGLRFIEAVRVNDKIKYVFTLASIEAKPTGRLFKFEGQVLIEGRDKPALVGSFLSLVIG